MSALKTKHNKERKTEVTECYFDLIDAHLEDLLSGRIDQMFELGDIADRLSVSQKHLIRIVKETRGNHPCHFYVQAILEKSKHLIATTRLPISEIAQRLTYDPSNFTKFFKKYVGVTPSKYRDQAGSFSIPTSAGQARAGR
ncbi:MAG: hypothetical protein ABS46_19780 [Cytophagaceae bacterium SCN 52-12]|nr:MAG: hypothetical protein ABS46_19780 [Cytophagaceae bacterium SCN 52-12]